MKNLLKTKLQICYSFVREQNRLFDIMDETEDYEHSKYLKAKIDEIERHLQKHFSSKTIRNCRDMHADYRNGDTYSRYEHGNWVVFQTNKKYGQNSNSWFAAKHTSVGFAGESLAIQLFLDAGFKAFKTKEKQCGDLTVTNRKTGESFSVEVKAARKSSIRNTWQFCLKKDNHTDCAFSDFVLFILFDDFDANYYLVPSSSIGKAKSLQFSHPTKYRGKFAPFYVRGIFSFESALEVAALKGMLQ